MGLPAPILYCMKVIIPPNTDITPATGFTTVIPQAPNIVSIAPAIEAMPEVVVTSFESFL